MRRVSKVRQEGPVQPYVPPVPPTSHALVQRKFTDLLRRSSDSVASNQHQQTMGSQAVHHHLRHLEEKRRRTKKNPSMQEVLMTGTPTGKAAGKSKFRSLMQPSPIAVLSHPFGPELKQWEQGVEVECGKNWSREMVEMALQRGAHPSAQTPEAIKLFEEDIAYQVNGGFCEVVLASDLMKDPPKNLKISPVATVPQANRRPRIILDLSFPVRRPAERRRMGPKLVESVNHTTEALSPQAPVKLIGKVLQELFEFMAQAPSESDVLLGKVDLSDGFWRMIVKPEHRWNFCYVLPQQPGRPMRIVVPYALQMGWQESPPYFCTATETGRDVIHWLIETDLPLPRHPMEAHVVPDKVGPRQESTMSKPWQVSVYVDDYILAVLSTVGIRFIRRVARASLYGIHSIFPPPIITGHTGGKDPISTKKLKKGDAKLMTRKEILGFEGNGQARTWKLPATKRDPICAELRRLERQPRIKRQRLEKITGKLINATRIAPAAKGLMTPFFKALHTDPGATKIRKKTFDLHGAMRDMRELLDDLERRPTHVRELVQFSPSAVGMDDASKHGMGGFWVSHLFPPTVWRLEFPPDVQQAFGKGILTINDLELAAILMQQIALEHLMKLRHRHSEIFSDNISATVWATKLMVHADSVIATRLVRAAAMRARTTESRMPSVHHWPGEWNPLADDTTRSFQRYNSGPMAGHTKQIVADASTRPGAGIARDLALAWRDIETATMDVDARAAAWAWWCQYTEANGHGDPFLQSQSPSSQLHVILAFAAKVRSGDLGKGRQVKVGTVTAAVRYVGQAFQLAGHRDPRTPQGSKELHLALSRLFSTYKHVDPATQSQVALPVAIFEDIMAHEGHSTLPKVQAAADLTIIAFYFLLRVGEYTKPSGQRATRTTQFRLKDATFWRQQADGTLARLPFEAASEQLLIAKAVTLTLDNQKNSVRDSTLHHYEVPGRLNPVAAVARRFVTARHVSRSDPEALLCQYSPIGYVRASAISSLLLAAARRTNLQDRGFTPTRIGSHSIRASGAMALYLNDVDPTLIKKLGRWRSETWLTYIHNQVGELTKGLATKMARPIVFHNVATARSVT